MIPFSGMTSLTGGGGLSTSSSSATGDQTGGGFVVGDFNGAASTGLNTNQMLIGGGILLALVLGYALSTKKR